jgi:hypothetical protein
MTEKELNHADRAHAPFGGSVAARRLNCTGSYFLEQQIPPEPPSPEAEEGTKAHECAEWALSDFLYRKVEGVGVDTPKPVFYSKFKEYAEGYVKAVWEKTLNQTITGKHYVIETVLVINRDLGMYGPSDFSCVYNDERGRLIGVVVDYKHGFSWVDCDKNDQLSHYACGLQEEVRRQGQELYAVRAAIYQPRAGGEAYRETTFTAKYLDKWKAKALKTAEQIFIEKKPKFKVGKWCGFCRGKSLCKAYAKDTSQKSKLELVNYKEVELPSVETLPIENVVKIVKNASAIEDFIASCKRYAMEACLNGDCLPGLKLVEGRGKRSWIDDEDTVAEELTRLGVPEIYNQKLKGITAIEGDLVKLYGKPKAKELMEPLTDKSSPQVLVDENDPRPAISSGRELLESTKN